MVRRFLPLILLTALIGGCTEQQKSEQSALDSDAEPSVQVEESVPTSEPSEPAEPSVEVGSECNSAFRRAASISDFQDTVEDLDPAIHACTSVDEWKAAARRHPKALDGVDPEVFLRNRCDFGGVNASLCDEVLGR